MSRKTRSFDQLSAYMDSEKSDSRFDLHHNYFERGRENIATAFFENSKNLKSRKNGNYLYHEILSISVNEGMKREQAKEALRDITLRYLAERCPRNMAYGCLHEDHAEHLHYHLMISANERDEQKRHRLSKKDFDGIKRELEEHVLKTFPELEQKRIITASSEEKKISRKASAEKRRTGKLTRQKAARDRVFQAMMHTSSFAEFEANLKAQNFEYYRRGKYPGVIVTREDGTTEKFRLSTIGAGEAFEEYVKALESLKAAEEDIAPPNKASDAPDPPADETKPEEPLERPQAAQAEDDHPTEPEATTDASEGVREGRDEPEAPEPFPEDQNETERPVEGDFLKEMQERREAREERQREKALQRLKRKGKPR